MAEVGGDAVTSGFAAGGFGLQSGAVTRVAASMRDDSELLAKAGIALSGLAELLPAPPTGDRLTVALTTLSTAWTGVLDDMVTSMAMLAGWMDEAVSGYLTADSDAGYRFGAVHR